MATGGAVRDVGSMTRSRETTNARVSCEGGASRNIAVIGVNSTLVGLVAMVNGDGASPGMLFGGNASIPSFGLRFSASLLPRSQHARQVVAGEVVVEQGARNGINERGGGFFLDGLIFPVSNPLYLELARLVVRGGGMSTVVDDSPNVVKVVGVVQRLRSRAALALDVVPELEDLFLIHSKRKLFLYPIVQGLAMVGGVREPELGAAIVPSASAVVNRTSSKAWTGDAS